MPKDLSTLSDDDLQTLRGLAPKSASSTIDLSNISDEQLQTLRSRAGMDGPSFSAGEQLKDAAKTVGPGLVRGTASIPGIPGDIEQAVRGMAGVSDNPSFTPNAAGKLPSNSAPFFPSSGDIVGGVEKNVTGPLYQPHTPAGKIVNAIAESAPTGALGPESAGLKAVRTVGGAVGSEVLGQQTAGTPYEAPYRFLGQALGGGLTPKAITPFASNPETAALVKTLRDNGITALNAGQISGSGKLNQAQDVIDKLPFSGGRIGAQNEQASRQFTSAVMQKAGEKPGTLASQDEINAMHNRISGDFQNLTTNNHIMPDPQGGWNGLVGKLSPIEAYYNSHVLAGNMSQAPKKAIQDITDKIVQNQGMMPGEVYQSMRSQIAQAARTSTDPLLRRTMYGISSALDDEMERSIGQTNPGDLGEFKDARQQYRNALVVDQTRAAPGEATAKGFLSPAKYRSVVDNMEGDTVYARGLGDHAQLANASQILPEPRTSTTSERSAVRHVVGEGGAALAAGVTAHEMGGDLHHVLGAVMAPSIVGRAINSAPAQTYLGNQILPQGKDPMSLLLARALAQSQANQPPQQ